MSTRKKTSVKVEQDYSPRLTVPVSETRDHIQGLQDAKVTLLEYGDYQCPYCGEAYPIVKRVQKKYGKDLQFVFRNFPLTEVHPRAEFGAEMAEASGAQGKFWEMHDYLYENQEHLANPQYFFEFARSRLGLDAARIESELAKHTYLPRIREDFLGGIRSGVNGTPSFYVNGHRHDASYEFESLSDAIDRLL